jgi:cbb3-type cytochrome oxidase subunit 3
MIPGIVTAILLASFVAGTAWAFGGKRRAAFVAAARMPLEDAAAWAAAPGPTDTATDAQPERAR